jgi:uncharacterized protein YxjI
MTCPRKGTAARRTRYRLPRRPLTDGARFGIQNAAGYLVFEVCAAHPDALVFAHPDGGERCTIHEATYGLQPLMRISRRGQPAAWVRKEVVAPQREFYAIDLGPVVLRVQGQALDYEFTIREGRRIVAAVSPIPGGAPESYVVEVAPGQDDALILAITVCITLMSGSAA